MKIVTLASGGLDSTLVACLAKEMGHEQLPLFIDYGQRARDRELNACINSMERLGLPKPEIADLSGFGKLIRSGLTDVRLRVYEDAYTPGRNMLFLLAAAAYAKQNDAAAIAVGLLHEKTSIFPDQTSAFLRSAEATLKLAVDRPIQIIAPLSEFVKADVVALAEKKGIKSTYSCHSGDPVPCEKCIACREFQFAEQ
jgi:7-cyano-7-deazaguanine synthase